MPDQMSPILLPRLAAKCVAASIIVLALGRPAAAASISLEWDPNPEPDIAGYVVHYGNASGTYTGTIDVGKVTGYTVSDLVAGEHYYFAVSAYDTLGLTSELSEEVDSVANASGTGGPIRSYYLAEGATGAFFTLDIALGNPNGAPAPVRLQFLRADGTSVVDTRTLPAWSRTTVRVDALPSLEDAALSTVVQSTSGVPLLVERTMIWDGSAYGGHTGRGVDSPQTRWLFGEGSQGFFDTYVLVANPNSTPAAVTMTFLRESGQPVLQTFSVPPTSRFTLFTGIVPELQNSSFAITVDSNQPVMAERAMYFGSARFWDGGHESAGVPQPATKWLHAEGATGSFFDTYILLGNPNPQEANATLTFLLESGGTVTRSYRVPPSGRLTVNVENEDPRLANAAISTTVTSDLPLVSERSMYWPGAASSWTEAHNEFGATAEATKWGIAEGRVGGPDNFETYILLANPSAQAADVDVTFLRDNGTTVRKTFRVTPTSRFNIHVNGMVPELANESFAAVVQSTNGVPLVVERSMYWSGMGVPWSGGTAALASILP
jgi:hypothetical protein